MGRLSHLVSGRETHRLLFAAWPQTGVHATASADLDDAGRRLGSARPRCRRSSRRVAEFLSDDRIATWRNSDGSWGLVSAALDGSVLRPFSAGAYWGIKRGASSAFVAFAASGDTSLAEARRTRQGPVPQSLGVIPAAPFPRRIGNLDVDELPIRGFTALYESGSRRSRLDSARRTGRLRARSIY